MIQWEIYLITTDVTVNRFTCSKPLFTIKSLMLNECLKPRTCYLDIPHKKYDFLKLFLESNVAVTKALQT